MKKLLLPLLALLPALAFSQTFTRADTLRGAVTPERSWWDAKHYDLHAAFDFDKKSLAGWNTISYQILRQHRTMQLDLMSPLVLDSVVQDGKKLAWRQDGNAYFIDLQAKQRKGEVKKITAFYHGNPTVAQRPPWDGGVIFKTDEQGRPWISVACQGVGASIWFPNKDHQYDEPDSAALHVTAPNELTAVGNGRLRQKTDNGNGTTTWTWAVTSPINNYNIIPYVGHYEHFSDTFPGENGSLSLDYWVLDYNLDKARERFLPEVPKMLRAFEHWFGAYPFYADGYKLVESPHLGMEHQSAVAYGNHWQNGYLGSDLSGSGWGLKWDFIIVHESGHEWFGNNVSTRDIADMWVHEGFTNYSETLYTGFHFGEEAASAYNRGCRGRIVNASPVVCPHLGVNCEGSGDMYYKGGSLLHTIRQVVADDEQFRQVLRGLNRVFAKKTVTTKEVEAYVSKQAGRDFSKVFDQYLRTTNIPVLEWKAADGKLSFRWTNCVAGFDLPLRVKTGGEKWDWIQPGEAWQTAASRVLGNPDGFEVDKNFYAQVKKVE